MNGDLSRLQREVILLSLRSWTRPRRAASQDTESDAPEREPADRLVMTTSASEPKCRDKILRGSTKEVKRVRRASFATDKTPGTEWSRMRGFEGAMRPRRDATATGAKTDDIWQSTSWNDTY